jgi:omega-amidase
MKSFKIGICQIQPKFNINDTVQHALEMIWRAAESGSSLVVLPEMFYYPYDLKKIKSIVGKEDEVLSLLMSAAKKFNVFLSTGSMAFMRNDQLYNMSHLLGPDGTVLGEYSKCHLYDVNLKNFSVSESSVFSPGNSISVINTELGVFGILICYDIRFPEFASLYAASGAEILLVPSVFNKQTGSAHWHIMMRARAIENQCFLIATSQAAHPDASYSAYGHSLAVSPWGDILTEATDNEEIVYCTIDPIVLEETRRRLPLLTHKRTELYNRQNISRNFNL